ncbi:MAG: GH92 family glycosyl hydrolase [Planctomycetaceae bacterium]|nr:GH92 family glycosyl hydrolase [Planctomycetaceae bacterium]
MMLYNRCPVFSIALATCFAWSTACRAQVLIGGQGQAAANSTAAPKPIDCVNPMVGTSGHGHTYPGATAPFGMVQLSPDTRLDGWDGCSGYYYADKSILGFSHTHISGTGCADLGDIRFTPISGEMYPPEKNGYHLPFSHDNEVAKVGYYSVTLTKPKVKAELTATEHAGMHRYTFPADKPAHLVVDLIRAVGDANGDWTPIESSLVAESKRTFSGFRHSKGWAPDKTFYFVAELSQPCDGWTIETDGKAVANAPQGRGKRVNAHFDFTRLEKPLLIRVGISAVSVEAARKNLAAEISSWDFDGVVTKTRALWSDLLGKLDVQMADRAAMETFYTSLYHTALAPMMFNDADGAYRGIDRKTYSKPGFTYYSTFSLWDTFRAEHPLLTIYQPQRVNDFVNTMLAHYKQYGKHALPVWSLAGDETWCMIGNHAIPVIVDAYAKGFRGFDAEAAYAAMRDTVMQDRNCLGEYRKYGYIPTAAKKDEAKQSVSRTLEYAYDDSCVARMAAMLGKKDDAELFAKRAENWRNVFDRSVGFARGKTADGHWRDPFTPRELIWADYTEATGWQYTWFVPQNVPGLIEAMGGDEKYLAKLDGLFTASSEVLTASPDITGLIGQYAHGNEPCHHIAYLYNYAGAPSKTQARVREICRKFYNNTVEGCCGNDDCGQMSAWYVLTALGFYPVDPASGIYVIGSPVVNKAVINLDPKYHKGKTFTIIAENNSPQNVYIQSATLNGQPLTRSWLSHAELTAGGELILKMGSAPNPAWGSSTEDRPPVAIK